ncbi:MAG: right-handed parallel beta-helix repeat-containing protein [Planctomycetes bacterium]|nr:right-handed parallel beta-helix repeat-containing protein [Planctomycetota bacterium]
MRTATLGLLCGVLCSALAAAEWFVAPGGNDTTGTGAIGAPFATLSRAHQAASPGDTITFRAGTYTGGFYITKSNLTFQGYTGETAIIALPNNVAGQDNAFYIGTAGNCTVRRLTLQGGYFYAIKIDTGPCLVEDCFIHGSGRDCVKIPGADNVTIRRCEIYNSGQRDPSNAEGIDNVAGDNMLVQDCYIHDIATNGVYPKGGSIGSIIERCLIRRCGSKGISMAQSSGLAFYDTTANPEYYSCRDCIARNNIIEECEGSGIDLESALRAKVYNNTMINVAKSSNGGIRIASADKGAPAGIVTCRDCEIRNNIIVLGSASARPMVFMGNNSHQGTLTMSNNRYYKQGGGSFVFWWEPTSYTLNLAGWKTTSGTDSNSTEGDPMVGASWHLNGGSPCLDAGMTIAGFSDDYDGNTRTGTWDIGADETGGTALTTPPPAGTPGTGGGVAGAGTPASPTGLVAVLNGSAADLSWADNSNNETGFRIERRVGAGAFATLTTTAADVTTFSDTTLAPGNNYTYRVIAFNASGDSSPSNQAGVTVPAGGGGGGGGGSSSGGGGCTAGAGAAWPLVLTLMLMARRRKDASAGCGRAGRG